MFNLPYQKIYVLINYYLLENEKQRIHLVTSTAMRDPRVWGEDANEFRLRDLKQYENLSTAWVEQAIDKENPVNNRYCPGKELSLAMISGFLCAFLRKREHFVIDTKINLFSDLLLTSEPTWEFKVKTEHIDIHDLLITRQEVGNLTPEQIRNYFSDLNDHPKFSIMDSFTKAFCKLVQRLVVENKLGMS